MEEEELYLLITRYLSNQTRTEENEELADWIAADKKNEETFEEIKRVWLGNKRPADASSEKALAKLHARIASQQKVRSPLRLRMLSHYLMYAAAVTALFIGCWFSYKISINKTSLRYSVENTFTGQKKRLTLEDGTRVILGPESSISYPEAFEKNHRIVLITGEAYFEVSKNPHRPFIVRTPAMQVQVLGTHFNINARKGQIINTVSLLEGKVKVNIKDDTSEEYVLKPGQELSVNHNTHQVFQHRFDSAAVLGWLHNILTFKNEELGKVAPQIERMYAVKIVFDDQATADTRIYATLNNQTITEVMRTICASGTLAYHREGNKIYLHLNTDKKQIK